MLTLAAGLLVGCSQSVVIGLGDSVGGAGGAGFSGAGGSIEDAPIDTNPDVSAGGSAGTGGGVPTESGEEDVSADHEGGDEGADGDSGIEGGAGAGGSTGQTVCGAQNCGAGSECCYLTAKCFDPLAHPEECPKPEVDGSSSKACGADSHCNSGEYCNNTNGYMCMGQGECELQEKDHCASVATTMQTCGCDGMTRMGRDSCLMGVRVLLAPHPVPCGVVPDSLATRKFCGNNSAWCPPGSECCAITGWCVESEKVQTLCAFPGAGSFLACESETDCQFTSALCQGPTCGAPGGCIKKPDKIECSSTIDAVCGCDGKDHVNLCWSQADGVPLDHLGPCVDGGS